MALVKYTDEALIEAVKKARNYAEVLRFLGASQTGSSHGWMKQRILKMNLSTSHFESTKDRVKRVSCSQGKKSEVLLVNSKLSIRVKCKQLRRVLLESGMSYSCHICEIKQWQGKSIIFEIDHIDGNWSNNLISNLRFLCPNCHSQTETYGTKNIKNKVSQAL